MVPSEIPLSVAIGDAVGDLADDPDLYSKRAVLSARAGADIVKVESQCVLLIVSGKMEPYLIPFDFPVEEIQILSLF